VITVASGYGQNPILDPNYTIDCSSECIAKDFPFQFCVVENGVAKFVRKCSSNPSDEEDANGNPMTVYKPNILAGLCTEYQKETSRFIENGIKKILNVIVRDEAGEQYVDYFDPENMQNCIWSAVQDWISACDDGNPNTIFLSRSDPKCCLKIKWTADERLIPINRNGERALANTSFSGSSNASCDGMKCADENGEGGPTIYLNQLPEWMELNDDGHVTRFFYSESLDEDVIEVMKDDLGLELYDICTTIKHEMGHYFGLQHPDDPDLNCPSGGVNSIMNGDLAPFTSYQPPIG